MFLMLVGGLALLASFVLSKIVRDLRGSWASVPNAHLLAPFSRFLWAFPHEYFGTITLVLPRLHERYGSILRTAPNEVTFYSLELYNEVYSVGSRFEKDPDTYGNYVQGHPALFSITDKEQHRQRRRLMGQLYNRSKIEVSHDMMLDEISRFVSALAGMTGRPIETSEACRALEADIMSRFSFGRPLGAVDAWKVDRPLRTVAANDRMAQWMPLHVSTPSLVSTWESLESLWFRLTGRQTNYSASMREWQSWTTEAVSALPSGKDTRSFENNLIATLVRSGLPYQTALSEARENIGPGTDTTSASMAHILWALAHNPQFQQKLRLDLARLGFPTDMTTLESIPRLQACVKEGIRWAGAAAAMLPRLVPPEGITFANGVSLPGGTKIASSPIWYLRDKTAFPNPTLYNPYRWLAKDGEHLSEDAIRDKYYVPFSKGPNACIGAHLSYCELYMSLAQILKRFELERPAVDVQHHYSPIEAHGADFVPVELPERREWVAAVPSQPLNIIVRNVTVST